jgi:hydrophobic/amphiphilic exporter-1 (mainly G- bacteria), HAE1 family
MKQLTRLAVERPLTILMVILALVILGAQGYSSLNVDRFPKVNFPYVTVITSWPGAAPEDIEQYITKPIEDAVAGISGVDTIQSTASQDTGITTIKFLDNVDSNQAATDVERALGPIKSQLPADSKDPTVIKADIGASPIMNVTLSGPQKAEDLYYSADQDVKPRLLAVPGVAQVTVNGGLQAEVQVQVDPVKMGAYSLSLSKINDVLIAENADTPAGSMTSGPSRKAFRALGRFNNVQDIQGLILSSSPQVVRVKDLANVIETHKDVQQVLRLNGQETVGLSITKQSDANQIQVADGVRAALDAMQRQNIVPKDAKFTIVTDDSTFTRASVDSVRTDLLLAVLITGLVLLLFLHTMRSTIIVLLAVPTSLISTFLIMYALGFTLDSLSLLALALTIGILVDNSIIVLENIFRHLSLGESPREAALNGPNEIGVAALAITLTDVVVYVPVAFMSGIVGQFFREYGITIAAATLFSLFVSFTLTPMLASRWFSSSEEQPTGLWGSFVHWWERAFTGLANAYARTLGWSLRHRPLIVFIAVIALAGAIAFIPLRLVGVEFVPNEDDGTFTANVRLPAGSSLDATDAVVRQVEDIVNTEPEVRDVLSTVGDSGAGLFSTSTAGTAGGSVTVKLVDKRERQRTVFQVLNDVRRKAASIQGASFQFTTSNLAGGGFSADLQVQVSGPDLNTLIDVSNQIVAVMSNVPGVADVRNTDAERSPELQAQFNRARLNDLGLSATDAGKALRTAIAGTQVSTLQRPGLADLDITLIATENTRNDPNALSQLPLKFTKGGTPITLASIGGIAESQAPGQIKRYDRARSLTITGSVVGRSSGDVASDIQKAINTQVELPPDYSVQMLGQAQQQQSGFGSLFSALALALALIYMLLVALYESFAQPLAIMFSLPVSRVGALGGLFLTGNTVNIFSLLGIIMLMGLVTKNAILLVDFADNLRKRGYARNDALVEAGRLRLRPILMTTAAVVFAMVPFVLKLEPGAESRAPMAAAVMGGVISSTLLTLVLVPTMYTYLDTLEEFVRRQFARRPRRVAERRALGALGARPCEPGQDCVPSGGK